MGGYLPTEDKLRLLGDLTGKSVLEIGCGNGRSIKYVQQLGATDLWGIDISANQIKRTRTFLESRNIKAKLICTPMEEECEVPKDYFDLVFSVYGIGWTLDLEKTFKLIYSYLKQDGVFVFGWSHPIHKCVSYEDGKFIFCNSYFNEGWYSAKIEDQEIMLSNRMLSTYVNALAKTGFVIDKLIENTDQEMAKKSEDDFAKKAQMLPTAFVLKTRKGRVLE